MPRKKPRFNDLKDKMIDVMSTGQDPKTSTNTEVARFSRWYLEPNNRAERPTASIRKTGGIVNVAIVPFAYVGENAPVPLLTTCSKRTADWLKGSGASVGTAANIEKTANRINLAKKLKDFYPAQAIIREFNPEGTERTVTSSITGRRYKTRSQASDKGYTVPFGTNGATADKSLDDVQTAIKTAVAALSGFGAPTFRPEEYGESGDIYSWA